MTKINRTQNATKNILFGVIKQIYQLLIPFVIRTAMIYKMGTQYVGLGSLFTSILSVLNLTELGIGSAMIYSMYKPIVEDDTEKICKLMNLYKLYYRVIGTVIMVVGVALTPLIPKLVTGSVPSDIDLLILYYINLGTTVLSYFMFSYKKSLLFAHQRVDVESKISLMVFTIQYILQLIAIYMESYYLYALIVLVTTVVNNIVSAIIVDRMYPQYKAKGELDIDEKKEINNDTTDDDYTYYIDIV